MKYSVAYQLLITTLTCLFLCNGTYGKSPCYVEGLTCEYKNNPLGIDEKTPRFSWRIQSNVRAQVQTAYELIVSDNERDVKNGKGNLWSSGRVLTDQSIHVDYRGQALQSYKRYYWRVRIFDKQGEASPWSDVNWFETGVLSQEEWAGSWINDGGVSFTKDSEYYQEDRMPLIRKSFDVEKRIKSARLYITGLGYYEAYLNGDKIEDRVLEPGWTAYDKQVLYSVYDITKQVRKGDNMFGVMLGNGWYNPLPLRFWGGLNWRDILSVGRPKLKAMIRIEDENGRITSLSTDSSWETRPGPIVKNDIYLGEHYDARLEVDDWTEMGGSKSGWSPASIVEGPKGLLTAQQQPPIRVTRVVRPVAVQEVDSGVFVFDMGQNFAGVARVKVSGPAGTIITLRYGEDRYSDGNVNLMTAVAGQIKQGNGGPGAPHVAWQEDRYTLKGRGKEVWAARFTFHGFRYVEVTGWPGKPTLEDIDGLRMSADLQKVSSFSSSNELFNRLDEVIQWTFLSNVFSVVSDCPAREKLAYGGDILCGSEAFMFNYDMHDFYAKTVRDHANDQRPLGGITETAPFVGIADFGPGDASGPLGYQAGYPFVIKKMYDFYGDKRIIETYYPSMKKQVEFLNSRASEHLFDTDLGDHESLGEKNKPLTASVFYHLHVRLLAEFAGIMEYTVEQETYEEKANQIRKAIVNKFFDRNTGRFGLGTQSDQLFGLWSDLVDGEDFQRAYRRLQQAFMEKNGHLSTGIFGTKMLFDVFRRADDNAGAYRVADQRTFPSWGHMVESGATTLWETWEYSDNKFSQNHPMFGSIGEWFYRSLLGINEAAPGFKKIIIKPQPVPDLTHARGEFCSVHGMIKSAWRTTDKRFELDIQIPVNTTAEVWVPNPSMQLVRERGTVLSAVPDIQYVGHQGGYTILKVGSGTYNFRLEE